MDTLFTILELVGGLVALTGGASIFVDGASGLARRLRIPPLVIGLTIVALGTSAPEVGVNVVAALTGQPALAIGNVLGSNILNILAVLGICAVYAPLLVQAQLVRLDVPAMILATVVLYLVALDLHIGVLESAFLLVLLGTYSILQVLMIRRARKERIDAEAESTASDALPPERPLLIQLLSVVAGATFLVLGSEWLVSGATIVARDLGIDERVIGLTVVAIGTSLPELAASLIATVKGERDIAVGNVVGSNIYNVLAVVGLTGIVTGTGLTVPSAALSLDFPVVLAASLACLPIFFVGGRIERWEGGFFLGAYAVYIGYLILQARGNGLASDLGAVVPFVLTLTGATAVVLWARELSEERAK